MALIAWFPLNNNLNNKGKNNYTLTSNTTTYTTGKIAPYSLLFNGSNNQAYMDNPFINLSKWSLSFWFKPNNPSSWRDIITFNGQNDRIEFSDTTTELRWYSSNINYNILNSNSIISTSITNNNWHHIAITFENNITRVYVDNIQTLEQTNKSTFTSSADKLYFGSRINAAYASINLQDIRCYDHCLSILEIKNLNNALVLHYDFENVYQPLEYIESTGQQYIDTGILGNSITDTKLFLDLEYTTLEPANQIMGFTGNRGSGIGTEFNNLWEQTSVKLETNKRYELLWTKHGESFSRTIDTATYSGLDGNVSYNKNMLLFAAYETYNSSTITYYCHVRLYKAQIWSDNILVRDFIPAIRILDKAVGLYDKLNNTFYTSNTATSLFTYKNIDYIESTVDGLQAIDTGVYPTANTSFELDFQYLDTTTSYNWTPICGERGVDSSTYMALFVNRSEPTLHNPYIVPNYAGFDPGNDFVNQTVNGTILSKTRHRLSIIRGQFYIDNNNYPVSSTTNTLTTSTVSFAIFAVNTQSGMDIRNLSSRLYGCKLWENDKLIRDLKPVIRIPDLRAGLIDNLNKNFYSNINSNNFVYELPADYNYRLNITGNDITDTWNNLAITSSNIGNNSALFNGTSSYIDSYIPLSKNMTFVCWIKFTGNGAYHIIDCRSNSAEQGYQPIYAGPSYGLQVYSSNNSGVAYTWDNTICQFTTNRWYHIAVTISELSAKLYIDGVEKSPVSTGNYGYDFNTTLIRLGTRCTGANWLDGNLSEVQIYNSILSSSDIYDLYKTRVKIDNQGNVYCNGILSTTDNLNLNDKGIIRANYIWDGGNSCTLAGAYIEGNKYIKLEYIESSGTQFIDTGITYSSDLQFEIDFSDYTTPSGSLFSTDKPLFALVRRQSNQLAWYSKSDVMHTYNSFSTSARYHVTCNLNLFVVNSITYPAESDVGNTQGTDSFKIFRDRSGTLSSYRLYSFKISKPNKISRNFIPVQRVNDSSIGLYDQENKIFYENLGTGQFIAGPIVSNNYTINCNNFYKDSGLAVASYNLLIK